ncbi:MAG TPA: hypothetical protein VJO35_00005, partial [Terriglobales bacterium]|nr:hypothetical protein [Terriglobales bacterium]
KYIGKESNSIEDVESGLAHSETSVYTQYPDPRRDEWEVRIRPILKRGSLRKLAELSGMSRSALKELRAGRSRPHIKTRESLISALRKLNLI